jgi:RNA polymerase sigma factor (sigma-70 family)
MAMSRIAPHEVRVGSDIADLATETDVGALVIAASDGVNWAWNELVRRYSSLIGAIARNHGLNAADTAEVSQITWMRLVENIGRIQQPDRVGAWIATTARRECLRIVRAARWTQPLPTRELADVRDPAAPESDEQPLVAERDAALRLAYDRLPPRCRMLLSLLTGDPAMSYKKLADVLDMRIGSIGPTRGRCLDHLRRLAAEHGLLSVS